MNIFHKTFVATAVLWATAASAFAQDDIAGASDHPLIGRYEGSQIIGYSVEEFTDHDFLVGAMPKRGGAAANPGSVMVLEGKVTRIAYIAPANRSTLEVLRNYETAFKEAGFETLFTCSGEDECGWRYFQEAVDPKPYQSFMFDSDPRYWGGRLSRPEGDVYGSVYIIKDASGGPERGRAKFLVDIIELKPMEERMVVVEADELAVKIGVDGRIALYGIEFDHDSDVVKPSSEPQIAEVAKYLKDNPQANVMVVGHTDVTGSFEYNRGLSERRAAAVVKKLKDEHGISADRMFAVGVGPAAPVATNRTEEGRARNRRVEIVDLPAAE